MAKLFIICFLCTVSIIYASNSTAIPAPSSTSHAPPSSHHIAPSPSSHAAPTSSAKPTTPTTTPKPEPEVHFELKSGNDTCLEIEGQVKLEVSYMLNNTDHKETVQLVTTGATVTGHCIVGNSTTADVKVTWGDMIEFAMGFNFTTDRMWYMDSLAVTYNDKNSGKIVSSKRFSLNDNDKLYQAMVNMSYVCDQKKTVMLGSTTPGKGNITVDFDTIKIQPFASNGKPFHNAMACPASSGGSTTSSIVPIAVGCALAGLIVIVLIAYLIGRTKNSKGYQQV